MKSENISIDNNLEILSKLNPKENSLTYTTKNNDNKNIHRTSILSSKVNNQNLKYNYLNNLPLEEKIKFRKRSNSTEIIDKNKNTEILLYKLKNINMSLEKEKLYINYFKYLKEKDNHNNNNNNIYYISNYSNNQKNIIKSSIELFIKNDDDLHKKVYKK